MSWLVGQATTCVGTSIHLWCTSLSCRTSMVAGHLVLLVLRRHIWHRQAGWKQHHLLPHAQVPLTASEMSLAYPDTSKMLLVPSTTSTSRGPPFQLVGQTTRSETGMRLCCTIHCHSVLLCMQWHLWHRWAGWKQHISPAAHEQVWHMLLTPSEMSLASPDMMCLVPVAPSKTSTSTGPTFQPVGQVAMMVEQLWHMLLTPSEMSLASPHVTCLVLVAPSKTSTSTGPTFQPVGQVAMMVVLHPAETKTKVVEVVYMVVVVVSALSTSA